MDRCRFPERHKEWLASSDSAIKTLDNSAKATATTYIGDTVKGVRIACTKEPGRFWGADSSADHSIFEKTILGVPAILGIPLAIHRVGTQSNNRADLDCQIATFLNVKYEDGLAPQWQSHVGTCLVAREDKEPLTSQHLEALWMYIDRVMNFCGEEGPRQAQKEITKKRFETWFENYKENEAENGRTE
ncbi:hypothetical protein HBI81_236420 [Parastagonospora nodorum]|nr:hypothetical protein HBI05_229260 [Parastagonospora nodorum]KAH5138727.1 hypothetical protein HBH69_221170 [Parastagonospora nodorum]KAH5489316.1 hypothetical protein HBI52_229130 [Parastagonospora nodorum]KAH6385114.1 hypothetical protein HBI60_234420 [Parastagonospora nodorum]KAH6511984.1 hypothetical protein HBI81_236420 [Parastagonospora nodorum]